MATATQDAPQGGVNRKLLVILALVGLLAAIVVIAFLFLGSKPSPEDIAQEYIDEYSSEIAKEIAEYMAANHWILERQDRESLIRQVRESISWELLPASPLGEGMFEVRAVASVGFGVSSPWASGDAQVVVPLIMTIDHSEQTVVDSKLDHSSAQFGTDLPSLDKVLHDIAGKYVDDKIDVISEEIARFIVGGNWLLKELGGEYVEDKIHDVIKWEYQPSNSLGNDKYDVVAVAFVEFRVEMPSGQAEVEAGLPFVMTIDLNTQLVDNVSPDLLGAYLRTDIPDVASIDVTVGEMVDFASGVPIKEAADTAKEAAEKAKGAVEAAKDTNCLEAAREAGVPDNIIDLIQKPRDERSGIENSILRRGLDAVGLSDVCGDIE